MAPPPRSAPPLDQGRQARADAGDGGAQVDCEHPVPGRHAEVVDGGEVEDPRTVDEHVDAAVAFGGRLRRRADRRVVREVKDVRRHERAGARFLDRRPARVERAPVEVPEGDVVAAAGERNRDRSADGAAAAGHDRGAPQGLFAHGSAPSGRGFEVRSVEAPAPSPLRARSEPAQTWAIASISIRMFRPR